MFRPRCLPEAQLNVCTKRADWSCGRVAGLSGCIASLVHDAVSNPAEVVKQRMQMLQSPYRGVWECARHVYRSEGARAFYRSYGTQVAMNVPFQALHFATYEACTARLNPARAYDPLAHALAGAAGGALAAAATTPLDVCKTVLNTQERAARADGLLDAAAAVLRASGPRGFFRGLQARVLYQMPAAAICWLTYETFKHALGGAADDARRPRRRWPAPRCAWPPPTCRPRRPGAAGPQARRPAGAR
ncbi:hypothetical protein HF086_011806 [Spodoptera exigua]|uniref:Mitoferrin-1 n=1 Tax=Spodoptera exigua TaxID=7107 RepID=A0A922MXH6_SPOEX|nr:hypothetical protein HF086_011806 [Spodoptera exigua]